MAEWLSDEQLAQVHRYARAGCGLDFADWRQDIIAALDELRERR